MLGHGYVLIARATASPSERKTALERAQKHLEAGDRCATCRYSLACVLAKKAESEETMARDELIRKSTELLLYVLERIRKWSIEPEISVIRRDPFLKLVVTQKEVKDALDSFKWDPKEDNYPGDELWHYAVPLKRVLFTRLNGDDRGLDVRKEE